MQSLAPSCLQLALLLCLPLHVPSPGLTLWGYPGTLSVLCPVSSHQSPCRLTGSYPELPLCSRDIHPTLLDFQFPLPLPSHGSDIQRQMSPPCPPYTHLTLKSSRFSSSYLGHHRVGSRVPIQTPYLTFNSSCFPPFPPGSKGGALSHCKTENSWSSALPSHPLPSRNPAGRISATFWRRH